MFLLFVGMFCLCGVFCLFFVFFGFMGFLKTFVAILGVGFLFIVFNNESECYILYFQEYCTSECLSGI